MVVERLSSMDEIVKRCCTLCAVNPGMLCYIMCKPMDEGHIRETMFKELMRMGDRFVWYEMRRETVVGGGWSRIRLLPYAGTKNQNDNLQGLGCDIFAMEHLNQFVSVRREHLARNYLLYVDFEEEDEI